MVVKGSNFDNMVGMYLLAKDSITSADGRYCLFRDNLDNQYIADFRDGIVSKLKTRVIGDIKINIKQNNIEPRESIKNNGYLYTTINLLRVNLDGETINKQVSYGVHDIIGMLAYKDKFKSLVEDEYENIVINHKDLNRTNNSKDNLEIITQKQNYKHGKIARAIAELYPTLSRKIKINKSGKIVDILNYSLSSDDIEDFEKTLGHSISIGKATGVDREDLRKLIDWLKENKNWEIGE